MGLACLPKLIRDAFVSGEPLGAWPNKVEKMLGAIEATLRAHLPQNREPLGGESAICGRITYCRESYADTVGNGLTAKGIADVRCRNLSVGFLVHAANMVQIFWICNIQSDLGSQNLDQP